MTFTSTITDIGVTTLAELIKNLAWFILIIWGVRILSREIGKGIKQIPEWIETYHKKQMERMRIQGALDRRT